jgi:hypothetical protein
VQANVHGPANATFVPAVMAVLDGMVALRWRSPCPSTPSAHAHGMSRLHLTSLVQLTRLTVPDVSDDGYESWGVTVNTFTIG